MAKKESIQNFGMGKRGREKIVECAINPFIPPPSILRIRIPFIGKGLTTPSLVNVSFAANLTAKSSDLSALIASGIAPSLVAKPKNQVIRIYLQK